MSVIYKCDLCGRTIGEYSPNCHPLDPIPEYIITHTYENRDSIKWDEMELCQACNEDLKAFIHKKQIDSGLRRDLNWSFDSHRNPFMDDFNYK